MKKLVSILTAGLITICCSLSVFAATSVTTTPNGDGSYTTSGNIDENQSKFVTIVVYEGGSISVDSIQYIDQTQADAEGNFSFDGYLPKEDVPEGAYYTVKIGATALTVPENGGIIGTLSTGITITGKITLQSQKPVYDATVKAVSTTELGTVINGTVAEDGTFTIPSVPDGTYNIVFDKPYYLSAAVEGVTISGENLDISTVTNLHAGDLNLDNYINLTDLTTLIYYYLLTSKDADFNPICDINEDNTINLSDLNFILNNYLETGYGGTKN